MTSYPRSPCESVLIGVTSACEKNPLYGELSAAKKSFRLVFESELTSAESWSPSLSQTVAPSLRHCHPAFGSGSLGALTQLEPLSGTTENDTPFSVMCNAYVLAGGADLVSGGVVGVVSPDGTTEVSLDGEATDDTPLGTVGADPDVGPQADNAKARPTLNATTTLRKQKIPCFQHIMKPA